MSTHLMAVGSRERGEVERTQITSQMTLPTQQRTQKALCLNVLMCREGKPLPSFKVSLPRPDF